MKKKLKIFTKAKIFLSVFLCVLLLGSNFVFAENISYINSIPFSNNEFIGRISSNTNIYYWTNTNDVYLTVCDAGTIYHQIVFSANNGSYFYTRTSNPSNPFNPEFTQSTSINGITYYYRDEGFSKSDTSFPNSNIQSSWIDSTTAITYALNSINSTPAVTGNFDLQVGNITFIDLGNSGASYDLTLKSYFNKLSGTLSGGWEYDNRRFGFSSELPTTSFSVDSSSGSGFNWTKTDPKNLIGRSHYGLSEISGNSTGRYLWIVNPLYNENYYNDSLSGDSINGRINVSGLPVGCTFYTYPLVQSATSISLASDVATTSGGTGTVSETGGNTPTVSIDDVNSSYTQPIGGDNSAPEEVTLQEGVNQLFQTLKDFTEKVINLLSAPADFIQQLISAGQSFTQAIASMFTWLPQAVQDVLIAALGVMIVVGFLKLLF